MKKTSFYSSSFQGRRKNNEDACIAIQLDANNILLAVADGMGGAAAGEIASKIAIEVLQQHLLENIPQINEASDFKEILAVAFSKIQAAIKTRIEDSPEYKGMGTTLTLIWIYKNLYVWANLGDSRIYFLNNKVIKQITKDHTYIQDFEDKHGTSVPPEMAAQYGNYIMRSLDGGDDVPDIFPLNKPFELLSSDSAFLLCSDGLIPDKMGKPDEHYHSIFLGKKTLKQAGETLIKFAYDKGSTDNITVVLAEFGRIKRKLKIIPPKTVKTILIVLTTLAIIFTGGLFLKNSNLIPGKNIKSSDSNIPDSFQSTSEFSQENTVVPKYPPYKPFPRIGTLRETYSKSNPTIFSFYSYKAYPERIKHYSILANDKEILQVGKNDPLQIKIGNDVKFETEPGKYKELSGNYKISVNVITIDGDTIRGNNWRNVKITD